eukprot:96798_1
MEHGDSQDWRTAYESAQKEIMLLCKDFNASQAKVLDMEDVIASNEVEQMILLNKVETLTQAIQTLQNTVDGLRAEVLELSEELELVQDGGDEYHMHIYFGCA